MLNTIRTIKLKLKSYMSNLARKVFGQYLSGYVIDSKNGLLACPVDDICIGSILARKGEYDWDIIQYLIQYLDASSKVLIVGAHIGSLLIPIAKHVKLITGIEANPDIYKFLQANIRLNYIENVELMSIAAAERTGTIEFLLSILNSGGSKRSPKIKRDIYYYDNPVTIQVPCAPLDSILKNKVFDLIVMDIEGSEYFALQGMQSILVNTKVLYIEYLRHHLENVAKVDPEEFFSLITPHFKYFARRNNLQFLSIEQLPEIYSIDDDLVFIKALLETQ